MTKSMGELFAVSDDTKIRSSHLIYFTGSHATVSGISCYVLSFADMIPDEMVARRNSGVEKCKCLKEDIWESGFCPQDA